MVLYGHMNEQPLTNPTVNTAKKPSSWKIRLWGILAVIVIAAGAYGYFWFTNVSEQLAEAQTVTANAQKFETINASLTAERDRCEVFITQGQGNFGEFEYCQRFLDWSETHVGQE